MTRLPDDPLSLRPGQALSPSSPPEHTIAGLASAVSESSTPRECDDKMRGDPHVSRCEQYRDHIQVEPNLGQAAGSDAALRKRGVHEAAGSRHVNLQRAAVLCQVRLVGCRLDLAVVPPQALLRPRNLTWCDQPILQCST